MEYRPLVDGDGNTLMQTDRNGQTSIRCVDEAGNSLWRPLTEFTERAAVGENGNGTEQLDIELGPVVDAPQAAPEAAEQPTGQQPTPAPEAAETEAQARSRRSETRTGIAAARERRQQVAWDREEVARAEADTEEAEEAGEGEAGEPGDFWLGWLGNWTGCAVFFFGPAVIFFPLMSIFMYYDCEIGGQVCALISGLTFWVGYIWFLAWQQGAIQRREVRQRLEAADGEQRTRPRSAIRGG